MRCTGPPCARQVVSESGSSRRQAAARSSSPPAAGRPAADRLVRRREVARRLVQRRAPRQRPRCPRSGRRSGPAGRCPARWRTRCRARAARSFPVTRYGSSCSSRPIPWPVRWMNAITEPGVARSRRAPRGRRPRPATPGADGVERPPAAPRGPCRGPRVISSVGSPTDTVRVMSDEYPAEPAAEVHHDGVAVSIDPVARLVVRRGAVRARAHDREQRGLVALLDQGGASEVGDLALGAARRSASPRCGRTPVGGRRRTPRAARSPPGP